MPAAERREQFPEHRSSHPHRKGLVRAAHSENRFRLQAASRTWHDSLSNFHTLESCVPLEMYLVAYFIQNRSIYILSHNPRNRPLKLFEDVRNSRSSTLINPDSRALCGYRTLCGYAALRDAFALSCLAVKNCMCRVDGDYILYFMP